MHSANLLSTTLPTILLLLAVPNSASTCRNITVTSWSIDGPSGFSNTNVTPLENVNCPLDATNGTCEVPRGVYNIMVYRELNITVTPEDEDAIFEVVQKATQRRTDGVEGVAINESVMAEQKWIDLKRTVDTNNDDEYGDIFFETEAGLNYTLGFLAFTRYGFGTLEGCDNETLNGVSIKFSAPYLAKNERNDNITEVAGQLYGSGSNTTTRDENAAGRLTGGGATLMVLMGLGTVLAAFL